MSEPSVDPGSASAESAGDGLTLHVLSGPYGGRFPLSDEGQTLIGRSSTSDVCLADPAVSRRHAGVLRRESQWYVVDHKSRAGTTLNGLRLDPERLTPIEPGDVLRIGPWTLRVSSGRETQAATVHLDDGTGGERVERLPSVENATLMGEGRISILAECLESFASARNEEELAETAIGAALRGSGFSRAAILGRTADDSTYTLIGSVDTTGGKHAPFVFSRSLVEEAKRGETVLLSAGREQAGGAEYGQSIVSLRIHTAACVPVFLGDAVSGFLYLDARSGESSVRSGGVRHCEAVSRAYGLALANLKRVELERREASLQSELEAARQAQRVMLPAESGSLGTDHFLRYAATVQPGLFVAGDLFDAFALPDGRVVVALGDVCGHGVSSAMLMTMVQSSLHARLERGADPVEAITALNRYVSARIPVGRFVSMWLAIVEPSGRVVFVDAGHGHAVHLDADGEVKELAMTPTSGGLPLGIDAEARYEPSVLTLDRADRLVIYSDGIIEQQNDQRELFGRDRLLETLASHRTAEPKRIVQALFDAVRAYAGVDTLDDDASVAVIALGG